jgi:hypothetical protein
MSDTHVDEDVVCKNCEARSREGFIASQTRSCGAPDSEYQETGYHDWVSVDQAHEYGIEVSSA